MRFLHPHMLLALAVSLGCFASGCTSTGAALPPPVDLQARDDYVIGATDLLAIKVWNNKDLDIRVPVRSDGRISVPLLDDVQAEGLTPGELKEVITEQLSEYIDASDVTVIVLQTNSKKASIIGGVGKSHTFPLNQDMRVLEAIASSGGFSNWAKKSQIRILRKIDNGLVEYHFDYKAYLKGDAPDSNLLLQPGDTIVVPD